MVTVLKAMEVGGGGEVAFQGSLWKSWRVKV